MSLKGKYCVITGAGSGIGKATALMMAEMGASVALIGRTRSKVVEVKTMIQKKGGVALEYGIDVSNHKDVSETFINITKSFERIDILVNSAGHSSQNRSLLTTTPEEINSVVGSNLKGSIYCSQESIPSMLKSKSGTIINVSSVAGIDPGLLGGMIYSAVKSAVINFTGFLNEEFKNTGIRASVVIPGEVDTPLIDKRPMVPDSEARKLMVSAEDVAEAITLIAKLPMKSNIPKMIIRPSFTRDMSEIKVV